MRNVHLIITFIVFLGFISCRQIPIAPAEYASPKSAIEDNAMVVSPHPLSSQVGVDILKQGGNAIDATVAVHFAMAVVFPRAGNIGGGGFMVLREADGAIAALDYREKAPATAFRDMYLDSLGNIIDGLSTKGHLASGVPGTVDGLIRAHQRYGQLDFAKLIQPAIDLARNGFAITQTEADRLNRYMEDFAKYNKDDSPFIKERWQEGDILIQENLAKTLRRIKKKGRAGFYGGKTADYITAEMKMGNGIITKEDLANYKATWRTPLTGHYKNYRVISMPPSSSGGVALLQLMEMMEPYPLSEYGFHSPESIHLMAEAERRVYADRAEYMGDMDFYPVPIDSLTDSVYLARRMADYSPDTVSISDSTKAGSFKLLKESFETTHTSIVDVEGNAVSVTTTINSNFGSKVLVHGGGFFLNNEMDDFSSKPGVPNQFGLIGAEANAIQGGKRMLSSMTPTIVEKDGELFLVLGAPGGSTIITAVFQVIMNTIAFDMPLDEAVEASRFHHQWLPDMLTLERDGFDQETQEALKALGHALREVNRMAVIKAVKRLENGQLHGAADPRNPDDTALGY
ncbi:MAG TPA: gamma-glutamyltransferase [Saprospiraceae bacterium]|nr:gamma-glutamyltransferase [Saprospiraceae bacterium]